MERKIEFAFVYKRKTTEFNMWMYFAGFILDGNSPKNM